MSSMSRRRSRRRGGATPQRVAISCSSRNCPRRSCRCSPQWGTPRGAPRIRSSTARPRRSRFYRPAISLVPAIIAARPSRSGISRALSQRGDAGGGNLLIFVRLDAGDANRADDLTLREDRQAALDRQNVGEIEEAGALFRALFGHLAGPAHHRGGLCLAERDRRGDAARAFNALQEPESARIVGDRDRDFPVVLRRLGLASRHHFVGVVGGQCRFVAHPVLSLVSRYRFIMRWPRPVATEKNAAPIAITEPTSVSTRFRFFSNSSLCLPRRLRAMSREMSLVSPPSTGTGARWFSIHCRPSTPAMKPKAMLAPYWMNSRQSSALCGMIGTLSVRETTKDMMRIEMTAMPSADKASTASERFGDCAIAKPKASGKRIETTRR